MSANPLSWIKKLAKKLMNSESRHAHRAATVRRAPKRWQPVLEQLEDRVVPTTWSVTLTTDAAAPTAGMLRYAINNSAAGDTIVFASGLTGTITLTSALAITHGLTIIGPGPANILISGNAAYQVFTVSSGTTAASPFSLTGVTVENGRGNPGAGIDNAGGFVSLADDTIGGLGVGGAGDGNENTGGHSGAGIFNSGTMSISDCTVANNQAYSEGGGIYNTGTLSVINSSLSQNGFWTDGGGIYNTGTATLSDCTLYGATPYLNASAGDTGGGFWNSGTLTLSNTAAAGNATAGGADKDGYGAVVAASTNNLIGVAAGVTGIANGTNGNQIGVATPGVNALAANGGPTPTDSLTATSPAIAHGGAVTTVGAAGIAATGASISLTNAAVLGNAAVTAATPVLIQIGTEQMLVTAVSTTNNTATVIRGYNGTTAAVHAAVANVYLLTDQRGYAINLSTTTPDIGAYQSTGTAPLAPTVTGASANPGSASLTGGTSVTISGTNLQNATAVYFGGIPGTIVSDSGTSVVATTPAGETHGVADATVTTVGWDTSATSPADQVLFGPLYGDSLAAGVLTITEEFPTIGSNLQLALSGGNYTLTDTKGFTFDVATGSGAASIAGTGTSTITIPSAAVTSISIVQGTGINNFAFTGTGGASAAPITVNTGTTAGDQANITGAVVDSGAVSLTSNAIILSGTLNAGTNPITLSAASSITQTAGAITGGLLTTSSATGTTLTGATNAVTSFNASNSGAGVVSLLDSTATLTVAGVTDTTAGGSVSVSDSGGALSVTGAVNAGSNPINLTASSAITQTAAGVITGGQLTTSSATGTTLNSATNAVTSFNATNTGNGSVNLQNSATPLTVGGITDTTAGGTVSVSNTGTLVLIGAVNAASNAVNLTSTTTITQAAGVITSGLLTTSSATGTTLNSTNAVTSFNASNTGVGTVNLLDSTTTLGVTGIADSTGGGSVTVTNSGGALSFTGALNAGTNAVNLTATTSVTQSAAPVITAGALAITAGTVGTAGQSVVLNASSLTANTTSGPNGSQFLSDTGTVSLTSANALNAGTGTVALTGGTFAVLAGAALTSTDNLTLTSPAIFNLDGNSPTVAALNGTGSLLDSGAAATLTVTAGGSFSGGITGANTALTLTGGSLALSGANTYGGPTTIVGGTLQLGSASGLPTGASITFGSATTSGTLDLHGFNATVAGLAVASGAPASAQVIGNSSTTAASTLTFNTGTSTFGGTIANTIGAGTQTTALTVAGGSLKLTGSDTFTGPTQVSAGQLIVDGSSGSAVTLSGTGVLGGTGTVGAITATAGTVDPGDPVATPAVLTASSANFGGTSNLTLGIAGYTTAGTNYDKLNLGSGALTAGGTSVLTLNLAGLTSSGTISNIIAYGSHTGSFATVSLINNPNNFQAVVTYGASGMSVSIVSTATHFQVTGLSGSSVAGTAQTIIVTALDAYNNVALLYTGTVHFTTTDPSIQAVLPPTYTFTAGDSGVHTFTGLTTLVTVGNQTVTAIDTANSLTGTSGAVTITLAAASQLVVTTQPSSTATAGVNFATQPTVKEEDQYGNVITTDSTHTVTVARGSLGTSTLQGTPLTLTLASGVATFSGLSYQKAETINLAFTTNATGVTAATSGNIVVSPNTPTQLIYGAQPSNVTAGTADSPAVMVKIEDAYGNVETADNVSSLSMAVFSGPTGGVFAPSSTTTVVASGGIGTFSNLVLDTAGSYTLKASDASPALTSAASSSFVVSPITTPTQLVFGTQPSNRVAGLALNPVVTAKLEDQYGNVETGDNASTVSVGISSGPAGAGFAGGSITSVTVSGGVATFTTLILDAAGSYALQASDTSPALTSAASSPFVVSPAAASQVVFGQQPTNTTAGVAISPAVTAKIEDQFGNVETGDSASQLGISVVSAPTGGVFTGGSTTTATVSAGVATFSNLVLDTAGNYTLHATDASPSLASAASSGFVVNPAAASQLVFGQQPGTSIAGVAINPAVTVKIEDQFGNVETGDNASTLTMAVLSGPATSFATGSTTSVTVNAGQATFNNLALNPTGAYTLQASDASPSLTSAASSSFVVNPAPTSVNQLVFQAQPVNVTAGVAMSSVVTVAIEDHLGNVQTADNSSTLTLTIASGPANAAFATGSTVSAVVSAGVATFSTLIFDVAGSYTLEATDASPAITSPASSSFTVTAASASQLAVTTQPSATATAGVNFATQPVVKEEDQFGNVVTTDSTSTVTVARGSLGTASLQGSLLTVTLSSGVATFSGLSYNVAQPINLNFTTNAAGVTAVTSNNIAVVPATAAQVVFGQQPTSAIAGVALSPSVTLKLEDQYGNVETSDNASTLSVAIAGSPTGGVFAGGSTTSVTVNAGIATFPTLILDTAGSYTLQGHDTALSLTSPASSSFTITPSSATQLAITQQPSSTATAGVNFTTQPVVKEEDQFGNVITTDSASTVTVARGNLGTGTLQGSPLTLTLSNGVANFSGLSYDKAETMNLNFTTSAGSFTATSNNVVVSPAAASQLVITQQPSGTATAGVNFAAQPVVAEEDPFGNIITSDSTNTVTAARGNEGTASLQGGPLTLTLSNGVATFSGLAYDKAETINLAFNTSAGAFTTTSNNVVVSPAAASQLVVTKQPSATATAGLAFATQPVVAEEDQFGNIIASNNTSTVTAVSTGTAALQGTTTLTLSGGVAAFSGLSYDKAETLALGFSTNAGSFTTTSSNIAVSPAAASQLVITQQPSSTATAGVAFATQPVVAEEDQFGNILIGDSAHTVTATSTGTAAVQGAATITLVNGMAAFTGLAYDKAETTSLSFSTNAGSFTAGSTNIVVSPAAASQLVITQQPSSTATAGVAFATQPIVKEEDSFGNIITTDSIHTITAASTGTALLQGPTTLTFSGGVVTFSGLSYNKAETMALSFSTNAGGFTTTSSNIAVSPAAASQLVVTQQPSSTATAGVVFATQPVVAEEDPFGNIITSDTTHTVTLASTGTASLLGTTSLKLANGVATFSGLSYDKAETMALGFTTNAGSFTTTSNSIVVSPAGLDHFTVTGTPATIVAGTSFPFAVTAQDFYGNTVTGFAGVVTFSSTDTNTQTSLPAASTLTNGVGAFNATLTLAGKQTITAKDGSFNGTSSLITVTPATLSHFAVTGTPASIVAGNAFSFAVTAEDLYANTETGYAGTVAFTSTDTNAQTSLPTISTLTNGVGSFIATLTLAGTRTITATDTVLTSVTGTSANISVSAAAASHFVINAPTSATAGTAFSFSVTAEDPFGNTAPTYTGTVHFTSSDTNAQTTLPANSTLTNGVGSFSAKLTLAGTQTITAADTVASSIKGTSNAIVVHAAAATHFALGSPTLASAGTAFLFTVTALDQFNNTAVGYTGTVHFTSTDTNAQTTLPSDSTLIAGVGAFSVTLTKAGSQTITAADAASSISQTSSPILVLAGTAAQFVVSAPTAATADKPFAFGVTVEDAYDNVVPGYTGTVHFTSTDNQAALPADTTISNGVGTFNATLKTPGFQTLTATDTVSSAITGTSSSISVTEASLHFVVSAPSTSVAGSSFAFTVNTFDSSNTAVTFYEGTVHFTSTDGIAILPANTTLTNGSGTFTATLETAGAQTISATDTANPSYTGTTTVTVSAASASHFAVSVPPTATAGVSFTASVVAEDPFGNTAPTYSGTVHFTSSDGNAVLPADSTLTNGVGSFNVTLQTAGSQTLTATDTVNSHVNGTSSASMVHANVATHYLITAPSSVIAGTPATFTVTALDQFNNQATGYTGTVSFGSSDAQASLPGNSTLTNGVGTFSFTMGTAGTQTLTATDIANSAITGTRTGILVTAGGFTHFAVAVPSSATAGVAFTVTVTAEDAFNNTVTTYGGTVHFASSDGLASVPANSTLNNGVGMFGATLKTAGSQTLTADVAANPAIFTTSAPIEVSAAGVTHLALGVAGTATAGIAFTFTVTAEDAFGNTVSGYAGTVHLSSGDGLASLPGNSSLINGVGSFSATLRTSGNQTLQASDVSVPALAGSSTIAVQASSATHFGLSTPANATAGTSFMFTVTALDQFNNTATGYTGTVQFSSSDANAQTSLPAASTLVNGTETFVATLTRLGSQTLTVSDQGNSLTATNSISVAAAAASNFVISGTPVGNVVAGTAFSFTVTALDPYNNVANYTGLVHFSSTDTNAQTSLPANSPLTNGSGTFSAALATVGSQTITATDPAASSVNGTSAAINVIRAPAASLLLSAPAHIAAGTPFTVTVTADDKFGNTATGYAGTVHFTSSDPYALLPASYTFSAGDAGVHTFTVTMTTEGLRTLTVADKVVTTLTTTNSLTVSGAATHYAIAGIPASTTAGNTFNFTVTALDALNQTAIGYTGTVKFTSNDPAASLPVAITLTNGAGSFSATLKTAGPNKTITATDSANAGVKTVTPGITVYSALTTQFVITTPANVAANTAFSITVKAQDAFGNATTPTVHFSNSDGATTLPANTTLVATGSTFATVKLPTLGAQTLTVTDVSAINNSAATTSNSITVYGAATQFVIQPTSTSVTAGTAVTYKVTALDANGDTAMGYRGTVHFTSNDPQAVLPVNTAFTAAENGVNTFTVTYKTAGNRTLTATDTVTGTITGQNSSVTVVPTAASKLILTPTSGTTVTAGNPVAFTVTAVDAYGNIATNFAGTVHFTSSDAQFVPFSATLSNGVGFFSAALATAGARTITASATGVTAASGTFTVTAAAISYFLLGVPASATAGIAFTVTVTAKDAYGNTVNYTGTVQPGSPNSAILPASVTVTKGVAAFNVTLETSGANSINVVDTATDSIFGKSASIMVAAPVTREN